MQHGAARAVHVQSPVLVGLVFVSFQMRIDPGDEVCLALRFTTGRKRQVGHGVHAHEGHCNRGCCCPGLLTGFDLIDETLDCTPHAPLRVSVERATYAWTWSKTAEDPWPPPFPPGISGRRHLATNASLIGHEPAFACGSFVVVERSTHT